MASPYINRPKIKIQMHYENTPGVLYQPGVVGLLKEIAVNTAKSANRITDSYTAMHDYKLSNPFSGYTIRGKYTPNAIVRSRSSRGSSQHWRHNILDTAFSITSAAYGLDVKWIARKKAASEAEKAVKKAVKASQKHTKKVDREYEKEFAKRMRKKHVSAAQTKSARERAASRQSQYSASKHSYRGRPR